MLPTVRLQKYLAECGVASRRASEAIILAGRVKVNGQVVTQMGVQITPGKDLVSVDGKRVAQRANHAYYMFYKPRGVVCTMSDENGRKCVADFFKQHRRRLYPVGRLDMDSEGLLLVTDDGAFANRVMHPKNGVRKVYLATLDKPYGQALAQALTDGLQIGDERPARAYNVSFRNRKDGKSVVELTLTDGRNRQARRMFEAQGFAVLRLKRIRIGELELSDLKPGASMRLSQEQAQRVFGKA